MTHQTAHYVLDAAKRGQAVSMELIEQALKATGDLPQDWPSGVVPVDPLEVV